MFNLSTLVESRLPLERSIGNESAGLSVVLRSKFLLDDLVDSVLLLDTSLFLLKVQSPLLAPGKLLWGSGIAGQDGDFVRKEMPLLDKS